MIKPKASLINPKSKQTNVIRKPSLPIKRNQSILSNYSCLSDRIYDNNYKKGNDLNGSISKAPCEYSKNYSNASSSKQKDMEKQNKMKERIRNIARYKQKKQEKSYSRVSQHYLTGFQWLLVLRRCFYQEFKKRNCKYIKQRTLINYVSNKMYPDTLWNSILVHDNETKFNNNDIVQLIENQGKSKMNLDEIFLCLSKIYKSHNLSENQSAAETARFMEQMKSDHQNVVQNVRQISCQNIKVKQPLQEKKPKKNSSFIAIQSLDMSQFSAETSQLACDNISPVSVVNQTNNISFSIENSSQNSNYYSTANLTQKFELAFARMQSFQKDLQASNYKDNISLQKKTLLKFMEELLAYSLYKSRSNGDFGSGGFFYGLKISPRNEEKIGVGMANNKNYQEILKKLFSSQNFQSYFRLFSAIKVYKRPEEMPFILTALSHQQIKILNLSNNNIKSLICLKQLINPNSSLQFLNLNDNKIQNISQLLALQSLKQLYLKNNQIDHVIVDKQKVIAHQLKIIDLGCNYIQRQEDLWALTYLVNLKTLNLYGNIIMETNVKESKGNSMLSKEIIVNCPQIYMFSAYTQYKDIAFQTKNKNRVSTLSTSRNITNKLNFQH